VFGPFFVRPLELPCIVRLADSVTAGFVRRVRATSTSSGWDHVYSLSYFFGFFVSGITHWALHTICPVEKQTGSSPFEMELHRKREEDFTAYVNRDASSGDEEAVVVEEK
jgi:NCS1 family nucleobase:cation symporter-1